MSPHADRGGVLEAGQRCRELSVEQVRPVVSETRDATAHQVRFLQPTPSQVTSVAASFARASQFLSPGARADIENIISIFQRAQQS
jgi:hypothetical protein